MADDVLAATDYIYIPGSDAPDDTEVFQGKQPTSGGEAATAFLTTKATTITGDTLSSPQESLSQLAELTSTIVETLGDMRDSDMVISYDGKDIFYKTHVVDEYGE